MDSEDEEIEVGEDLLLLDSNERQKGLEGANDCGAGEAPVTEDSASQGSSAAVGPAEPWGFNFSQKDKLILKRGSDPILRKKHDDPEPKMSHRSEKSSPEKAVSFVAPGQPTRNTSVLLGSENHFRISKRHCDSTTMGKASLPVGACYQFYYKGVCRSPACAYSHQIEVEKVEQFLSQHILHCLVHREGQGEVWELLRSHTSAHAALDPLFALRTLRCLAQYLNSTSSSDIQVPSKFAFVLDYARVCESCASSTMQAAVRSRGVSEARQAYLLLRRAFPHLEGPLRVEALRSFVSLCERASCPELRSPQQQVLAAGLERNPSQHEGLLLELDLAWLRACTARLDAQMVRKVYLHLTQSITTPSEFFTAITEEFISYHRNRGLHSSAYDVLPALQRLRVRDCSLYEQLLRLPMCSASPPHTTSHAASAGVSLSQLLELSSVLCSLEVTVSHEDTSVLLKGLLAVPPHHVHHLLAPQLATQVLLRACQETGFIPDNHLLELLLTKLSGDMLLLTTLQQLFLRLSAQLIRSNAGLIRTVVARAKNLPSPAHLDLTIIKRRFKEVGLLLSENDEEEVKCNGGGDVPDFLSRNLSSSNLVVNCNSGNNTAIDKSVPENEVLSRMPSTSHAYDNELWKSPSVGSQDLKHSHGLSKRDYKTACALLKSDTKNQFQNENQRLRDEGLKKCSPIVSACEHIISELPSLSSKILHMGTHPVRTTYNENSSSSTTTLGEKCTSPPEGSKKRSACNSPLLPKKKSYTVESYFQRRALKNSQVPLHGINSGRCYSSPKRSMNNTDTTGLHVGEKEPPIDYWASPASTKSDFDLKIDLSTSSTSADTTKLDVVESNYNSKGSQTPSESLEMFSRVDAPVAVSKNDASRSTAVEIEISSCEPLVKINSSKSEPSTATDALKSLCAGTDLIDQVPKSGLDAGNHPMTLEKYLLTLEKHPSTPEKYPSTPEKYPSTPEKYPSTLEKHPSTSGFHPSTLEKQPLTLESHPPILGNNLALPTSKSSQVNDSCIVGSTGNAFFSEGTNYSVENLSESSRMKSGLTLRERDYIREKASCERGVRGGLSSVEKFYSNSANAGHLNEKTFPNTSSNSCVHVESSVEAFDYVEEEEEILHSVEVSDYFEEEEEFYEEIYDEINERSACAKDLTLSMKRQLNPRLLARLGEICALDDPLLQKISMSSPDHTSEITAEVPIHLPQSKDLGRHENSSGKTRAFLPRNSCSSALAEQMDVPVESQIPYPAHGSLFLPVPKTGSADENISSCTNEQKVLPSKWLSTSSTYSDVNLNSSLDAIHQSGFNDEASNFNQGMRYFDRASKHKVAESLRFDGNSHQEMSFDFERPNQDVRKITANSSPFGLQKNACDQLQLFQLPTSAKKESLCERKSVVNPVSEQNEFFTLDRSCVSSRSFPCASASISSQSAPSSTPNTPTIAVNTSSQSASSSSKSKRKVPSLYKVLVASAGLVSTEARGRRKQELNHSHEMYP